MPPTMHLVSVFVTALVLGLLLTPLARWAARLCGLVDRPDGRRKLHPHPIPVAGGPTLLLVVSAALALVWGWCGPASFGELGLKDLGGLLLGGVVIVGVGIVDDKASLRGRHKLIGQMAAVAVVVGFGVRIECVHLFGLNIELGLLAIPFTAFFLLGAINSLNLLDGMDGLLSTVGFIISLALGGMAVLSHQPLAALVALALAGALFAFLIFNFPPASIFLGDSGSMLVGLTIGVLAIQSSLKGPATLALAAPAALLILPIFDTSAALVRRKLTGRSLYSTDRGHLHHCLLRRGLTVRAVLLLVLVIGLVSVAGALGSVAFDNEWMALLSSAAVLGTLVATRLFGRAELELLGHRVHHIGRSLLRGAATRQPRELELRLHGGMDWKSLWQIVLEDTAGLNLIRVSLDVNAPALNEGYHASWECSHREGEQLRLWRAAVPLSVGGMVIGNLEVVGQLDDAMIGGRMASLARLVEKFETGAQGLARTTVPAARPMTKLLVGPVAH